MNSGKTGLFFKMTLPSFVLAAAITLVLAVLMTRQQESLAVNQARAAATSIGRQVLAERQVYTHSVVQKLKADQVDVTASATPDNEVNAIPLPATFVHKTSAALTRDDEVNHTVDLLSLWNINPNKGWRDQFEKVGLKAVADDPGTVFEGVEGEGDTARYRAIIPDVGSAAACVDCHNEHPDSPKTDFQRGDVMGGIVVSMPMGTILDEASINVWQLVFMLVGGIMALLVLQTLVQWFAVTRPLTRDLQALETAADRISTGELDDPVTAGATAEVSRVAKAFDRMRMSLQAAMQSMGASTRGDDDL